jgi:hypothetical protein
MPETKNDLKNQQTRRKATIGPKPEKIALGPHGIPLNRSLSAMMDAEEKRPRPKSIDLRRKAQHR